MKDNGAGESLRALNVTKDAFSNQRIWKGVEIDPPPEESARDRARRLFESDPVKYTQTGTLRKTPEERAAQIKAGWTKESRKKLSKSMKKAHKRIPTQWKNRAARLAAEADGTIEEEPQRAQARPQRRNRMIGILIDQIRAELHQQIRQGAELTPFHTNVLALTDYLRKEE